MKTFGWIVTLFFLGLSACKKEPDNALTRYGENLAQSEQRAKEAAITADKTFNAQKERLDAIRDQAQQN